MKVQIDFNWLVYDGYSVCKHSKQHPRSINNVKFFFDQLSDCHLAKMESFPWGQIDRNWDGIVKKFFFQGEVLSSKKHFLYSLIIIHKSIAICCTDTMLQLKVPERHFEPDYSVVVIHVIFKGW